MISPTANVGSACGSSSDGPIAIGCKLSGRFEIRRFLGAGPLGAVWSAYDGNRDREIALKVIWPQLVRDDSGVRLFTGSAKAATNLRHPNIVNVYDFHRDGSLHFLSMELLKGRTLREEMRTRASEERPFAVDEAVGLIQSAARAVAYAHAFTLHGNLKPENIWLCSDGTVKVMDFGLASCLPPEILTMTTIAGATAYYLAPEIALRSDAIPDGRADEYSLAAILYELLAGRPVAGHLPSIDKERRDISRALARVVERGLAPHREDRFPDATAFSDELTRSPARAVRKRRAVLGGIVGGVAIALATIGTGRWTPWSESSAEAVNELQTWTNRVYLTLTRVLGQRERLRADALELNGNLVWTPDQSALLVFGESDHDRRMFESRSKLEMPPSVTPRFSSDVDGPLKIAQGTMLNSLFEAHAPELLEADFGLARWDGPLRKAYELIAAGKIDLVEPLLAEAASSVRERRQRFDSIVRVWSAWTNAFRTTTALRDLELAAQTSIHSQAAHLYGRLDAAGRLALSSDYDTAALEFDALSRDATQLAVEHLQKQRAETVRVGEEWKGLFRGRTVPLLLHIEDIDELVSEGDLFAGQARWAAAWANYSTARKHLQNWIEEVRNLPSPEGQTWWENSLGMRFAKVDGLLVSIWETRIMDFVVFLHEGGLDHGRGWRIFGWDTGWFKQGPTHPMILSQPPNENLFCIWLTERERNMGLIGPRDYYRLPTVAEWQRFAGLTNRTEDLSAAHSSETSEGMAPRPGNFRAVDPDTGAPLDVYPFTAPVGRFPPNALGLYDLWGNVSERCMESADSYVAEEYRVLGGSYRRENQNLTAEKEEDIGFRIVLISTKEAGL